MNLTGMWATAYKALMQRPSIQELQAFVKEERAGKTIYPASADVLRAYAMTPMEKVKVVIMGQDPYHNGSADGLAFSSRHPAIPQSLQIIFREINRDIFQEKNADGFRRPDLTRWAEQGVLLINPILTVEAGKPLSHAERGWEEFTNQMLMTLCMHAERTIVFMCWGVKTVRYVDLINGLGQNHHILRASHPAAELYRTNSGFLGCGHFSKANLLLTSQKLSPIEWTIM